MKKIIVTLSLIITFNNIIAQTWVDKMQNPTENFYTIQQEFKNYWQNKTYERGKGYKAFKRWEWFTAPRVYPSGDMQFASRSRAMDEFNNYKAQNTTFAQKISNTFATTANWTALGPFGSPLGGDAGRLTFIRFMPGNNNIIFVGTGAGGLWKSTDGGNTWNTNTDNLSVLGCSDLAINPINTNIMYLATGDVDGSDTKSVGVLKTIDGGLTWNPTGLNWTASMGRVIGRLQINPLNPNLIFAAASTGLLRSRDGGNTWVTARSGNFKDIEYRINDTLNIYAVNGGTFVKSTNGGATFVNVGNGLPASGVNRMCLSVTANDANYIYILCSKAADNGYYGLYRSINGGVSFTQQSTSPNIFGWQPDGTDAGGQGWYDIALAVSPTNKDEVVVGGVNSWQSFDGGVNWQLQSHWYGGGAPYVHADKHFAEFLDGNTLFLGHDGGISKSTDDGISWTTINGEMNIAQSYKIGQSATTASYIVSGHQDNGTNLLNGTSWSQIYGGDGMDCFVDWSNNNTIVESYVYGDFNRSTDGGNNWTNIVSGLTGSGPWLSPIIQSPHNANTYYCGYQKVFKSTNKGTNWTALGTIPGSPDLSNIAAAKSNSLVLYATASTGIYKTTNGGTTWISINSGLPTGLAQVANVVVNNTDANNVYVCFSGYAANEKVYSSFDGGLTWTNISAGLPNLPTNCLAYTNNLNDAIYVGTDVGVYYRNGAMASWIPYFTGLPNVIVTDLEIFYPTSKLRAATYGRGIWETPLYSELSTVPTPFYTTSYSSACINTSFIFKDQSSNIPTAWSWTLTGATPATASVKNPTVNYTATGVYNVSLQTTNAFGTSTVYTNTISVVTIPTLALTSATICNGQSQLLFATGANSYAWSGGLSADSVVTVMPSVSSVYTCTGYVGACLNTATTSVKVGVTPTQPTVTQTGFVLTSSIANNYQWYFNGGPLVGETNQTYTVTQNGYYSVLITNADGCQSSSSPQNIIVTGISIKQLIDNIKLLPNPAKDFITIKTDFNDTRSFNYSVFAANGQLAKTGQTVANTTIAINDLAEGVYTIKFTDGKNVAEYKFVKNK